jgi:hypothetical protein
MTDELNDDDRQRIIDALYAGRRIEAIKIYREAKSNDLTSAVQFVNQLEARLRDESPERFTAPPRKGCGTGVLMVVVSLISAGVAFAVASALQQ